MTSVVANTLNNIDEMLLVNSKMQKALDSASSKMDKFSDFNAVFDKTVEKVSKEDVTKALDKVQQKEDVTKVLDKVQQKEDIKIDVEDLKKSKEIVNIKDLEGLKATLEDLKSIKAGDETQNWVEFKEVLDKITAEANVETSLDLTLARDINEIIAQLKEAIENTTEVTEDSTDYTASINQIDLEDSSVESEDDLDSSENEIISLSEEKVPFEQLLTLIDTTLNSKTEPKIELKFDVEKVDFSKENDSNLETLETYKAEVVEIVENISDDISTQKLEVSQSQELELNLDEEILRDLKIESFSAESQSSNGDSFMQNQSPEEYAIKAMINQEPEAFEVKVDSVQNVQNAQQNQTKPVDVNPSRIIDQIVKHMENLQNNSKVTMVLNPESLGKVNIQLLTTKEGMTAQFTVATQEARDLIMKGLDGLKESLMSHGVGVDNISVKVADTTKSEYRQEWTEQEGSRGGNKGQGQPNREEKEKGLFEKMMAQSQEDENGNV